MPDQPGMTLGDVISLQRGTTYKSGLLDQPGPVLLGLASIQREGGFRRDSLRTYGGESPDKLILRPGDIYVSLKDVTQSGDLLGAVARVPAGIELGRLTQDTVKLEFTRQDLSPAYLYWLLRTPQYRGYCRSHAIGTTNLSLARDDFLAFGVPQPTRARLALVDLLGALDDKIELNRRMNETLERTVEAIFRHMTSGAVSANADDEFVIVMGQSPPGKTYNGVGAGTPFFQGRTEFGFRYPIERVYCTAPTRLASAGDTLVSVRAPVGDINMALEDCAVGRGVAAVRHRSGSRSFTYYTMRGLRREFDVFESEGTVFGSLSKKDFHRLQVPALPGAEVARFEELGGPLDQRIEFNARESRTLAALRDALLPKLISGELRIRDVERAVDQATLQPPRESPGPRA